MILTIVWFNHLAKAFSYKEVQFKYFRPPVKTNHPSAKNVNWDPLIYKVIKQFSLKSGRSQDAKISIWLKVWLVLWVVWYCLTQVHIISANKEGESTHVCAVFFHYATLWASIEQLWTTITHRCVHFLYTCTFVGQPLPVLIWHDNRQIKIQKRRTNNVNSNRE